MPVCVLCGAATQSPSATRLCALCESRWKDSPEFKRAAYFKKLKRPGPVACAFADFVFGCQKEKQNEEAEARVAATDPKRIAKKEAAEAKWEAEKKAKEKGNGATGPEKPVKP